MEISLDVIRQMAIQEPRRFYLRGEAEIDDVCRRMISAISDHCLPSMKLKTLELLMLISDPGLLRNSRVPVYLSQKNVRLARDVRQRITEDLSFHPDIWLVVSDSNFLGPLTKGHCITAPLKGIRMMMCYRPQDQSCRRLNGKPRKLFGSDWSLSFIRGAVKKVTAPFPSKKCLSPLKIKERGTFYGIIFLHMKIHQRQYPGCRKERTEACHMVPECATRASARSSG